MSPRPMRMRRVLREPATNLFKPAGIPARMLEEIIITIEEFESIRLKDKEGLDQTEAAKKMDVSQPTFQRIYNSARKKIAEAIVEGKAMRIEGGNYRLH